MKISIKLLFYFAALFLISCSSYRKYEGIYQFTSVGYGDYLGINDTYKIKFKCDSVSIGDIHYYHKNTGRSNRSLGKSIYYKTFTFTKNGDTIKINSGDTLDYQMNGDRLLHVSLNTNNKKTSQTFLKKKLNFRIRFGNGKIRF